MRGIVSDGWKNRDEEEKKKKESETEELESRRERNIWRKTD